MKKNVKLFINLLVSSFIITSSFNITQTYARADVKSYEIPSDTSQEESYEDIVDALENKEYDSIKKVSNETYSNNPSIATFSENEDNNISLSDGTYVIDRKDGWILGNDQGFIQSIIIPPGATGTISTSKTIKTSNSFSLVASVEFNFEFVSSALKAGYGYSAENSSTISINQSVKAPEDKSLFAKAQTVHRRFDTINVKNNKIVDLASTYVPVSHTLTKLEFEPGEKVNQSKLFEKKTYNIFGDQEIDNKYITDKNVTYEKGNVINNNFKYEFDLLSGKSNTVGLYFDVQETGKYSIGSSFFVLNEYWYDTVGYFGTGNDMTLYKVSDKNEQVIEKVITSLKTDSLKEDITDTNVLNESMPRLEANLKKGEKYLIIINKDKVKSKHQNDDSKFSYTVYFDKK